MKRKNSNLIQNYTDSDLQSFAILENFDNYKIDSIETKNIQLVYQSADYTLSDNQQFKKLMNFNKNIKTSSKEYSIDDFSDSDDLTDKRTHKDEDSFYNESDMQNFKNLKQFPLSISSDSFKYSNKKEDPVVAKINSAKNIKIGTMRYLWAPVSPLVRKLCFIFSTNAIS